MTYLTASDDYGVMRKAAVTIQAADDALAGRPAKAIDAALKRLVTVGLLEDFEHQGRSYVFTDTWQNFQRVKHPRDTMQPCPPTEALELCTPMTRKLFESHPAKLRKDVGNISEEAEKEKSESGSLACARKRETANGKRLTANGSEETSVKSVEPPPMDVWARELVNLYPAEGRCGWNMVERPLFKAINDIAEQERVEAWGAWEWLKARLEQHKRSHQWRMKGMVKRLDRWLTEGLFNAELPEQASVADQLSPKTSRNAAAVAEIMREP